MAKDFTSRFAITRYPILPTEATRGFEVPRFRGPEHEDFGNWGIEELMNSGIGQRCNGVMVHGSSLPLENSILVQIEKLQKSNVFVFFCWLGTGKSGIGELRNGAIEKLRN